MSFLPDEASEYLDCMIDRPISKEFQQRDSSSSVLAVLTTRNLPRNFFQAEVLVVSWAGEKWTFSQ
jgi:hypothetical protein